MFHINFRKYFTDFCEIFFGFRSGLKKPAKSGLFGPYKKEPAKTLWLFLDATFVDKKL